MWSGRKGCPHTIRTSPTTASRARSARVFESALREGVLGEEYELVGVYNEEPGEDPGFEYELFIVSVGSEV